jgi:hypothetical protein
MATENHKTQIGDEIRNMTAEEIVAYQLACDEVETREQTEAARQALKQTTLAKLGLTADEIASLLS